MTPGQIAYEAYSDAVGGASAVTGTVLPSWAGTTDKIRVAWEAAAEAVLRTDRVDRGEEIVIPPGTPPPGY